MPRVSDLSTPAPIRPSVRAILPFALVALTGAVAYSNSFDVQLQFDDIHAIVLKPEVHAADLSPTQLARATVHFPFRRWFADLSFAVNYAVHGVRPAGYHAVNLVIHLGAALLVLLVSRRLLAALRFEDDASQRRTALIAALLFVAHPVNTQAVTYVVQRMASMGTLFGLLTILCWLEARDRPAGARWPLALGGLVAWVLAVGCKENLLVVPVLIVFLEWVVEPRFGERVRAHWRAWLAGAALLAAAAAFAIWAYAGRIAEENVRFGIPLAQRLLTQPAILFHYLSLLAFPFPGRLHVDYSWAPSGGLLSPPSTLLALLGLATLVAIALRLRTRAPLLLLAVGWFLIALSIEQSALALDLVFEQRLYFSGIGFLLLAASAIVRWVRIPLAGPWAVAAPAVLLLAAGTYARNEDWRDPTRLYASEGTDGPGARRNLLNLAKILQDRGEFDEAEASIRRAIAQSPDRFEPPAAFGNLELERGRPAEAERWYRIALELDARIPNVWHNLGLSLERQKRDENALYAFERALLLAPAQTRSRLHWALITWRGGDKSRALVAVDEAIAIDPGSPDARTLRAQMRFEARDYVGAEQDARVAVTIEPRHTPAREMIVRALAANGRTEEARQAALELLRLSPGNDVAQRALGSSR
jgi:tetratricopeptide (TPR) repeat protein